MEIPKDPDVVRKEILETLRKRDITELERLADWTAKQMAERDKEGNPLVAAVLAGSWYVLVS